MVQDITTDSTILFKVARRFTRYSANLPCQIKSSQFEFEGTVSNISCNGARVEGAESVKLGAYVEVTVSRLGDFVAKIRWRSDGKLGVEFVLSEQQQVDLENRIIDLPADEI
jgi:hypothetical protein